MVEPRNKTERRPAHIPPDWLTRQQAALRLGITPYLLRQLGMATTALRGTDPLPSGLENLLSRAERYLEVDLEEISKFSLLCFVLIKKLYNSV